MLQSAILFAVEAAQEAPEGGLFELNATLPLVAVQTLILMAILNAVFYKPFSQVIDQRAETLRKGRLESQQKLDQAKELASQYEAELSETRRQAQKVIADAKAEADRLAAEQFAQAQQEAQKQREQAQQEIDEQRQAALQSLEQQVNGLSQQILEKLLGSQWAN
ncbi:MAG: F0F1 ATP synthase subunit B' [Prochlorotrichaceae cyanobacterium]